MNYYYLILSLHLISIVVWMGTLFSIYRLIFIQKNENNPILHEETFYLYEKFAKPSFALTILFGIILIALNKTILSSGIWIYLKFFLISLIIMIHHMSKNYLLELETNNLNKTKSVLFYHSIMPFSLFACVAILTITKPF